MRIAVTGASGLIGRPLVRSLRTQGHEVVRLVRGTAEAFDEVAWDPRGGTVDMAALGAVEAVVHLAGAPVGPESYRAIVAGKQRWTESYKSEIRDSRVDGTRTLATALAGMDSPPKVLVSGSAIGYYGQTGAEAVDESAPRGSGFLADVVRDWEAAADPARSAGIRVVHPRTGLVVSGKGGTWGQLWPIFRLGAGGRLGTGEQYWSFISLRDEVRALQFLLDELEGPVNLTAPNPVTNREVTKAMGELLRRPTVLPVPKPALQIALGEFTSEVLDSARVIPRRLLDAGFTFTHPTIEDALLWAWVNR